MTDENIILLRKFRDGQTAAEQTLIEKNTGLVHSVAHRFAYCGTEYEDLVQIGMIGLIKAIRNFDCEKGVMFSTYAVPVIIGEIRKFLRDDGAVKVSRSIRENYIRLQKAGQLFEYEHGREATVAELAKATELSEEDIALAFEAGARPLSLDEQYGEDKSQTLADTVKSPEKNDIELFALREGIQSLEKEERQIIVLRYFSSKTQQEVANIMHMTQVQVSRKEKKILEKLKNKLL